MGEILTTQEASAKPLANFLKKKDRTPVDPSVARTIQVPAIFYWENTEKGISYMMTMAFRWKGQKYGMSYEINDDNRNHIDIMRKKLFAVVKETMDVIVHHGAKVLDSLGNIDPRKVNEQEALRFWADPLWAKRVAAFNKMVKVAPITSKKAVAIGLLDKPEKI